MISKSCHRASSSSSPKRHPHRALTAPLSKAGLASRASREQNARARILVFDDDPGFCLLLSKVLRHSGYDVESCSEPSLFEQLLKEEQFDGLVLDYYLGGFTGPQAALALSHGLPTLFVSSDKYALRRLPKGSHWIPKGAGFTRIVRKFEHVLAH